MKSFMYACIGIAALVIATQAAFGVARAQAPKPHTFTGAQSSYVGRYQVVNGTPQFARNIMLLDTVTGMTWVYCNASDGSDTWCYVPVSMSGTKGTTDEGK